MLFLVVIVNLGIVLSFFISFYCTVVGHLAAWYAVFMVGERRLPTPRSKQRQVFGDMFVRLVVVFRVPCAICNICNINCKKVGRCVSNDQKEPRWNWVSEAQSLRIHPCEAYWERCTPIAGNAVKGKGKAVLVRLGCSESGHLFRCISANVAGGGITPKRRQRRSWHFI